MLTPESSVVDECGQLCVFVDGSAGGRLSSDADGVLYDGRVPADGRVCATGTITPGARALTWDDDGAVATASIEVATFGSAYGLDKPAVPLTAVPWVPAVTGLRDPPVLEGTPDDWDALATMAPGVLTWGDQEVLYYAGTAVEHFSLGVATRPLAGGPFTKRDGNPILSPGAPGATPGSWKNWAQNTPEPESVGHEAWLYYNGQGVSDGKLAIGLATGPDPFHLVDVPENPVLAGTGDANDWDGRGVAHPSIVQRNGAFEMWYASGTTFSLGYAVSSDGKNFERYCGNPVFSGLGEDSWDRAHVKSPEVWFDGATYFMTYSGCDKGCYEVGWAASDDGLRWIASPDPIIPAQPGAWNRVATREAYVWSKNGGLAFVYTGNDGEHERIGEGWSPVGE